MMPNVIFVYTKPVSGTDSFCVYKSMLIITANHLNSAGGITHNALFLNSHIFVANFEKSRVSLKINSDAFIMTPFAVQ